MSPGVSPPARRTPARRRPAPRPPPEAINVGAPVRLTEPDLERVECLDVRTNTRPMAPACGLKGALEAAQRAFLTVLDGYFGARGPALIKLWRRELARAPK